jgi:hypothetical protein
MSDAVTSGKVALLVYKTTASRWPEWSVPQRVTYEIRWPIDWGTACGTAFYRFEIANHRA